MRRSNRNLLAGGFFVLTVVLAGASVAYGCVQMIGRMTVTGTNGGVSTAVGSGVHPPYNMYCVPPTNEASAPRATDFANRPAVDITYGPATDCNPIPATGVVPGRANTPSDGTYEVNFCDGKVFARKGGEWGFKATPIGAGSCFFNDSPSDRGVIMGTMMVTGGSGSARLRIPAFVALSGPSNAAGIAVRRTGPGPNAATGPADVNLVPISII